MSQPVMTLALILHAACSRAPSSPADALSKHFLHAACRAPHVVVGEIVLVDSFEDQSPPHSRSWSHLTFRVDESLRGQGRQNLHLVVMGGERLLEQVRPYQGAPLQGAVGLRYALAYVEFKEAGTYVNAGDPGVIEHHILLGSPERQAATVAALRQAMSSCTSPTE